MTKTFDIVLIRDIGKKYCSCLASTWEQLANSPNIHLSRSTLVANDRSDLYLTLLLYKFYICLANNLAIDKNVNKHFKL